MSTLPLQNPPRADEAELPLTFGVELEFNFLINQPQIEKPNSRHTFLQVQNLAPDEDDTYAGMNVVGDRLILQAATIIRSYGLEVVFRYTTKADPDYDAWIITYETAAHIDDNHPLLEPWTNGKINARNQDEWNSRGLEVVSRILNAPTTVGRQFLPNGLTEVANYLNALHAGHDKPWIFLANEHVAGLHVHIGLLPGNPHYTTFPLPVIRHLAYICVAYEDIISLFHHPQRRGFQDTKTYFIAESNRFGFTHDRHSCGRLGSFDLHEAAKKIFATYSTVEELIVVLGNIGFGSVDDTDSDPSSRLTRMKFVNFIHLHPEATKQTIEFRQHVGTLDATSIKQWVIFLTALVRAAERLAAQPHPPVSPVSPLTAKTRSHLIRSKVGELRKYRTIFAGDEERLDNLYDLLQLTRTQQEFWSHRIKKYRQDEYTSFPTYMTCVACEESDHNNVQLPLSTLAIPDDKPPGEVGGVTQTLGGVQPDGAHDDRHNDYHYHQHHYLLRSVGHEGFRSQGSSYLSAFPTAIEPGCPGYAEWVASFANHGTP